MRISDWSSDVCSSDLVTVLRRAVDTTQFHPARRSTALRAQWDADADTPVLIHVGRIAPEKNLALAVHAFRQLQHQQPQARMVFVGDGPDRAADRKSTRLNSSH